MVGRKSVDLIGWTDVVLTNIGFKEVDGTDIASGDPLRIQKDFGEIFQDPEVIQSRDAINAQLSENEEFYLIDFDVLAPSDSIIFRFYSTNLPGPYGVFDGDMKNNRVYFMQPYEIAEGLELVDANIAVTFWVSIFGFLIIALMTVSSLTLEQIFGSKAGIDLIVNMPGGHWLAGLFAIIVFMIIFDWFKRRFDIDRRAFGRMREFVKSSRSGHLDYY